MLYWMVRMTTRMSRPPNDISCSCLSVYHSMPPYKIATKMIFDL